MALVIGYTVIVTRRHRGLESAYIYIDRVFESCDMAQNAEASQT